MDTDLRRCELCGSLLPRGTRDQEIGQRLRTAREARGLTRRQVAEAIYASPGTLGQWETGYATVPASRLDELATVLGIPRSWLR